MKLEDLKPGVWITRTSGEGRESWQIASVEDSYLFLWKDDIKCQSILPLYPATVQYWRIDYSKPALEQFNKDLQELINE